MDAARLPGFVQGVDRQVGVCHQRHHHGAHERGLRCAKSTDYAPEGCPFGFDLYDEDYYRNFAWSISVYPKLSDIDLDYGTFSTRQGKAKCTYEEKNFDDSWESQDDSTHFTVNGSFSIRDGKLSVTIDDED